jgi:hypothetical protein
MRDRHWKVLLDSIDHGSCIPVIGSDLSVVSDDGDRHNLAIELSHELATIIKEEKGIEVPDPNNLSLTAQMFQNQLTRDELISEVKSFYENHTDSLLAKGAPVLERLAALPFSLFVTSRHDIAMERCLHHQDRQPEVKTYHFKGNRIKTLGSLGTINQPLVYQLYGAFDDPQSLVITANDVLDFLKSVVAGEPGLPVDLQNLFHDKNFLFLGFGLGDYHLRVLLHALKLSKSNMSFALENPPVAEIHLAFEQRFTESVLFYEHLGYHALRLLTSSFEDFIHELHQRWIERHPGGISDALSTALQRASHTSLGDGLSVFISYVMEDEDRARLLVEGLRAEGLQPWIDKEGLRFGAKWNESIERAVQQEVDYFVVLQSRALSNRIESYVHKEVKLALERQDLRAGRFIFPVQIDADAERLAVLERAKIQTGTLYDWASDVKKLAREIRRDSERQKRG